MTQEAKFKIILDQTEAKKIVDGLEKKIKELQDAAGRLSASDEALSPTLSDQEEKKRRTPWFSSIGNDGRSTGTGNSDEARKRESERAGAKPQGSVFSRFLNRPLEVPDPLQIAIKAARAIPLAGPTIAGAAELGLEYAEYGPMLTGFAKGVGVPVPKIVDKAAQDLSSALIKAKAFGKAFAPTFQMLLETAKLQAMSGQVNVDSLPEVMRAGFDIEYAQIALDRKIREQSMKLIGEGVGSGLADFVRSRMAR